MQKVMEMTKKPRTQRAKERECDENWWRMLRSIPCIQKQG